MPRQPARIKSWLLGAVACAAGYLLFAAAYRPLSELGARPSSLEIEAVISGGTSLSLFVNADFNKVYLQPIVPGKLHRYVFDDLPTEISYLRIDPTDEVNQRLTITEMVYRNGKTELRFDTLHPLAQWQRAGISPAEDGSGEFVVADSNDPMFWKGDLGLVPAEHPDRAARISAAVLLFQGGLAAVVLYVAAGYPLRLLVVPVLLAAAALRGIGVWTAEALAGVNLPLQRADIAVGNALYTGYSKLYDQLFCGMLIATGVALAAMLAALVGRFRKERPQPEFATAPAKSHRLVAGMVILFFFAAVFPEVPPGYLSRVVHTFSDFDSTSVISWQYLAELGRLPYRDYWFPYAGRYNQLGPFPSDLLLAALHSTLLFAALFIGLLRFFRGSLWLALLPLAAVGLGIQSGFFVGDSRYLTPVALVICYYACLRDRASLFSFFLCGLFAAYVFYFEPAQLIYAGPAVFLITLWFLRRSLQERQFGRYAAALLVCLLAFCAGAGATLWQMSEAGQLAGMIEFYRNLSGPTVSSAVPAHVASWLPFELNDQNLIFWLTLLLLAGSSYAVVLSRGKGDGLLPFSIGLVLSMILLKMLVRPHMGRQMLGVATLGVFTLVGPLLPRLTLGRKAAGSFLAGFLIAAIDSGGIVRASAKSAAFAAASFPAKIGNWMEQNEREPELVASFFAPEAFKSSNADQQRLIEFLASDLEPQDAIYVLGNASTLYIILQRQTLPYTVSLYDGASYALQQKTITWLEQHKPKYIIWDTADRWFDGVPNITRTPLLHEYIIFHYVPVRSIGKYALFRPRAEGEAPDIGAWKEILGNRIELGAIPFVTSASDLVRCIEPKQCLTYLRIDDETYPERKERQSVLIRVGEHTFEVEFLQLDERRGDPAILLDRLWFWKLAERSGLPVRIETAAEHVVDRRANPGDVLY